MEYLYKDKGSSPSSGSISQCSLMADLVITNTNHNHNLTSKLNVL